MLTLSITIPTQVHAGWKTKGALLVSGVAIRAALKSPRARKFFINKVITYALQNNNEAMHYINKGFDKFITDEANENLRIPAEGLKRIINKYYGNILTSIQYPNSPIAIYVVVQ